MEHNNWKRKKDLENTKKVVVDFEKRLNVEIRQQEKLELIEKRNFRRKELLRKYIVKKKLVSLKKKFWR